MLYGDGSFYGDGDFTGDGELFGLAAPFTSKAVNVADADYILRKQGDTLPYVEEVLRDGNGAPVNLSAATEVRFIMKDPVTGLVKVNAAAEIVDALGGEVRYRPLAADFDTVGIYLVEWQVTFSDGRVLTFPTGGPGVPLYRKLKVQAQLA